MLENHKMMPLKHDTFFSIFVRCSFSQKLLMHKNLAYTNKTSPCSKSKINKKLNTYLVMPHKKFEDFLLQVTRDSCFHPDRKLSMSFFA